MSNDPDERRGTLYYIAPDGTTHKVMTEAELEELLGPSGPAIQVTPEEIAACAEFSRQEKREQTTIRRRLTSMQRKGGERVRAKLAGKMVRIWSDEHGAWWRPERCGYTVHIEAAGIYTAEDAWSATHHCGPEKRIIFEAIP